MKLEPIAKGTHLYSNIQNEDVLRTALEAYDAYCHPKHRAVIALTATDTGTVWTVSPLSGDKYHVNVNLPRLIRLLGGQKDQLVEGVGVALKSAFDSLSTVIIEDMRAYNTSKS